MQKARPVPRPFSFHWGSGLVTEEATALGEYHEPAIQLLEYAEGEAAGSISVRFCYYSHDGRFQRSPLLLDESDIAGLRESLQSAPKLKSLLQKMLED
ncbi:MAG TPA: hypothetical protein VGK54_17500 [Chloroflexota bacterium]